jgi:tetratricopeptide (TPR) repeat protein
MQMRYAIFGVVLAGLVAFAQQTPSDQQSDQHSDQNKQTSNAKQQQSGKQSPSDANPFPEATSKKAEDAANSAAGSSAGSSDNSAPNGYSSSHVDLKRLDAPDGSESRISDGAGGFIHDPELAAKDDKVGKFYMNNGDFKGAYDRFKEATEVAPEDANAVFGLAESARGLHRTEEAVNNYIIYLEAVPDGKKSKDARKALAALGHAPKK